VRCAGVYEKAIAQNLLEEGVDRGLVSALSGAGGRFPQNIWSVNADGIAFEAQLENPVQGTYHGYPLQGSGPLRAQVLDWWREQDA